MRLKTKYWLVTLVLSSLASVMWVSVAYPAVIYSKTITTGSKANAGADDELQNCLGGEGCFYKKNLGTGDGISVDGMTFGGLIPNTIPLKFKVSAAEKAAITNTPKGTATLLVKASRDLGQRQVDDGKGGTKFADPVDWLTVKIGGNSFGDLFKNIQSTCPKGETLGTANCGPNFHTDIQASDSSSAIGQATLLGAIANDPTFGDQIVINLQRTADVGRLKIFQATLTFVPEPSAVVTLALGVVWLGWRFRHAVYPKENPLLCEPSQGKTR
jgi:hypothetical protein